MPSFRLPGGGSRKKNDESASDANVENPKSKKSEGKPAKPKKADETLRSVIKESTPGAAIDLLSSCEAFHLSDGASAVIAVLDVQTIGGLNRRQRGNPDKGTIVELISSNHITALATSAMIDEEKFGIIPTPETLDRMDEFSLLTNAKYKLATVKLTGSELVISEFGQGVPFSDLAAVDAGDMDIDDLVAQQRRADAEAEAKAAEEAEQVDFDAEPESAAVDSVPLAPETATVAPSEPVSTSANEDPFGAPEPAAASVDEPASASASVSEPEQTPATPEPVIVPVADVASAGVSDEDESVPSDDEVHEPVTPEYDERDEEQDEDDEDDDILVEPEDVEETIQKRFFNSDLNIEVSLEPLQMFINASDDSVPFLDLDEHNSWLARHHNELVNAANAEIEELRREHVNKLSEKYLSIMGKGIAQIEKNQDPDNPNTDPGKTKRNINAHFAEQQEAKDALIAKEKEELETAYQNREDSYAASEMERARQLFRDRNYSGHEEALLNVTSRVQRQIQGERDAYMSQMLEYRRTNAARELDTLVTRTLDSLAPQHEEMMREEFELAKKHADKIREFVDNNRAQDVAWAETTREKLARDTMIETKTAEFKQEMDALRTQYSERVSVLERENAEAKRQFDAELANRERAWASEIAVAKDNSAANTERAVALENRLKTLSEDKDAEYRQRISDLEASRDKSLDTIDAMRKVANLVRWVLIGLGIVLGILGFVIGLLIASRHNTNAMIDMHQAASSMRL